MVRCNKCGKEYPVKTGYFYQRKNGRFSESCKTCVKAASAARYEAKKDEINRRHAERLSSDPDYRQKKLESDRQSYQKHRAVRLMKQAEYLKRPEVKERTRAYFNSLRTPAFVESKKHYLRQYNADRRADPDEVERMRARGRQWVKDNPEKAKANTRNRRARLRAAQGSHTAADVQKQLELQQGRCFWCGCAMNGKHTVDHVIAIARGGSNGPENIVLACAPCNYSKQDKLPEEFMRYRREVLRSTPLSNDFSN